MKYKDFIKECGDKQVFKKLSIYVVSSWIMIQVLALLYEPFGLPKKSISIGVIILLIGFPLYIYYIWKTSLIYLELEGDELINERGQPIDFKRVTKAFRKMFFITLGIISIMVSFSVLLVIKNTFSTDIAQLKINATDKIAVLEFGNNTGDTKLDIIGEMASDWIIHGITENNVAQVISSELIENYEAIVKTSLTPTNGNVILNDYLKPKKIITGNYYLNGNTLLIQGSIITNLEDDTITTSFKNIECESNNPIDCIERLKQVILGYLITEGNEASNLQVTPPKFEAYQKLLEAKKEGSIDSEKYLGKLNEAIAIDPNYFEPKVLKLSYYFNRENFHVTDSLLNTINETNVNDRRQRDILNFYEALLNGDNKKIHDYLYKEYQINQFDIGTNSSMMVIALQFTNRPNEVEEIFNRVSFKDADIMDCVECAYRVYVMSRAYIELGDFSKAIPILKKTIESNDYLNLKKSLSSAYIRTNQLENLNEIIEKYELTISHSDWIELCMFVGKEFLLVQNEKEASRFFNLLMNNPESSDFRKGKASYYIGDFESSNNFLTKVFEKDSTNVDLLLKLAVSSKKLGMDTRAIDFINKLESQRADYQYGSIDYALAQYYISDDDDSTALKYLKKSVADGNRFRDESFQNDPHFVSISRNQEFKEILNFWNQ